MITRREVFQRMKEQTLSFVRSKLGEDHEVHTLLMEVLNSMSDVALILKMKEIIRSDSNIPEFVSSLESRMKERVKLEEVDDAIREGIKNRVERLCKIALRV